MSFIFSALRPAPLLRRCSFPVAPGDATSGSGTTAGLYSSNFSLRAATASGSRRTSVDNDHSPEHRHWHARLVRRH